jgi:hypothetical protein
LFLLLSLFWWFPCYASWLRCILYLVCRIGDASCFITLIAYIYI